MRRRARQSLGDSGCCPHRVDVRNAIGVRPPGRPVGHHGHAGIVAAVVWARHQDAHHLAPGGGGHAGRRSLVAGEPVVPAQFRSHDRRGSVPPDDHGGVVISHRRMVGIGCLGVTMGTVWRDAAGRLTGNFDNDLAGDDAPGGLAFRRSAVDERAGDDIGDASLAGCAGDNRGYGAGGGWCQPRLPPGPDCWPGAACPG